MSDQDSNQLSLFESDDSNIKPTIKKDTKDAIETPFSKYIVYVDESGDHSLQSVDENYPIFVLAFCVVHKRHYSEAIVPALEKFKFNYFGHDQVVLHENEIRKEKGSFNIFRGKEEKNNFFDELTGIIEFSNFILISCIIDKRTLSKQGDVNNPYHIALGLCMEKLYAFLQEKNQHNKKTHVVVECRGKKEDRELELEFRRICDGNNRIGIPLPFEIIFSDKKVMSSGLQLADLVARPIGLSYLRPEQNNRSFEVLKEKFYCNGGRCNAGKDYEGLGVIFYPVSESEKPR
ncbi:MAG: DUF3800 domain-containing protein [Gammaproteobacteria bacterium]|nr:DUF3800 domain-containing protein [Gammaproteobacteria bacterium]